MNDRRFDEEIKGKAFDIIEFNSFGMNFNYIIRSDKKLNFLLGAELIDPAS